MLPPCRGDVWTVDLDPTQGHEQAGQRPGTDHFRRSVQPRSRRPGSRPADHRRVERDSAARAHHAGRGRTKMASYVKCEDIRSIAKQRLTKFLGRVSPGHSAR